MDFLSFFMFLALATVSTAQKDPKIVNGTDAVIEEFPYLVSLQRNTSQSCAGSLLNDLWIVTAAHCIVDADPEIYTIEYATTEISNGFNGTRIALIERFIPHEDYSDSLIRNDIGLIKLREPLNTGLHASVVKLAQPGKFYSTGTSATVAGWGRIGTNQPISTVLKKVELQIYSYEDCKAAHDLSSSTLDIYHTNICAGVPEMGKSECNGDSGGPLLVNDVMVGIVSWSLKPCAIAPYPGVYTNVGSYVNWISQHTGISFQFETFMIRKL